MKFPCWSDYDSVYDGVDIEIHIVDHCNLNCAGCNHFCPLAEPFYITPESLRDQLTMAKEKIPSIKWVMLLGGEPTIHPQLLELCKITREIFPDPEVKVEILTNGKDLTPIVKNKQEMEDLNIMVTVALYDIEYNQDHLEQVTSMPLGGISWGRMTFDQTLVDITGSQDANRNFFHACHHQLPCFTIKDYKIYECPFAAHINQFKKRFNIDIPDIEDVDYLDLRTLTLDRLEEFAYQPKNICKYCLQGYDWVWHRSNRSYEEYTLPLSELFFSDYDTYEMIQNLTNPVNNESVVKEIDPNFGLSIQKQLYGRYKSKIDIIIPFYNIDTEVIERLYNTLVNQTIIKDCMVYLISDDSPNVREVISYFNGKNDTPINYLFLKNKERSGPGVARNKGLDNAFSPYCFFLDADDEFDGPDALEKLYKNIEYYQSDVLTAPRRKINGTKLLERQYLCKKEYLDKYNIRYGNYFVHEDLHFVELLEAYGGRMIHTELKSVLYHNEYVKNIGHTIPSKPKALNKLFVAYEIYKILNEQNLFNKNALQLIYSISNENNIEEYLKDLFPIEERSDHIQDYKIVLEFGKILFSIIFNENMNVETKWSKYIKDLCPNFQIYKEEEISQKLNKIFESFDDKTFILYIKNYLSERSN